MLGSLKRLIIDRMGYYLYLNFHGNLEICNHLSHSSVMDPHPYLRARAKFRNGYRIQETQSGEKISELYLLRNQILTVMEVA